jgi:choloylglycine hydrolase
MEFPDVLPWQLSVIASDYAGASEAVAKGKTWSATYGVVGIGGFKPQWIADGTNSVGLSGHLLYMPGHATYAAPRNDESDMGLLESLAFVLGTCSTVAEAKAAYASLNIVDFIPPQVPVKLPMHAIIHDKDSCAVIEFQPDGMVISDNPVQVATNAPFLDWHLTNVSNYLTQTPTLPSPVSIGGTTFAPLGQGSGFNGLPGDGNSPSRFIRVLADVRFAQQPKDEKALLMDCVRILHNFDIVPGTIMEPSPAGGVTPELTLWSTVSNLTGNQYLVNTVNDPLWYSIDLAKTDFTSTRFTSFPNNGSFTNFTV